MRDVVIYFYLVYLFSEKEAIGEVRDRVTAVRERIQELDFIDMVYIIYFSPCFNV